MTRREAAVAVAKLAPTRPDVWASIVNMTPALALEYLGANTGNRHTRPQVVSRYARDMAAGAWDLNGETIKIAASGRVLDGQHRLLAVIEADTVVQMFVVTGLDDEAQDTVDRGLPRNIADALRLHGEVDVNVLAAAISQTIVMRSPSPGDSRYWPSSRQALAFLDENPSIRESVKQGGMLRKAIVYPASTGAALHFIFSELDQQDADAFFLALASGIDLEDTSPILRLREMMIREIAAPRRMGRPRLQALTIKSWNAWRKGAPMLQLKWAVGGSMPEPFPRPE